jgi:cytochrome c-type biogenesis protein CcmF
MVAGLHTLLIFQATGHSLKASLLFSILSFVFVLYSTFLTRTGILGDTSVHAFTEAGAAINAMIGMMVIFFAISPILSYILNSNRIPAMAKEEETSSREFWMFIGSLLLFLSALFIIIITSIPVFNKTPFLKDMISKIHGGPLAMPEDPEFLYNKVMVLVAIMLGLMTAVAQYLKYKRTETAFLIKKIGIPSLISGLIALALLTVYPLEFHKHGAGFLVAIYAAFVSVLYSFIANASYLFIGFKGKLKLAGGSIAHAGFALMLLGILISSANKKVISDSSVNGINLAAGTDPMTRKQDDPRENLTLIRDVSTSMGPYRVTYTGDSLGHEKGRRFYSLVFEGIDKSSTEHFILKPDVYLMKDNNMSSNPDIRSFIDRDVFTYISFAMNEKSGDDTSTFRIMELAEGDTGFYSNGIAILTKVHRNPSFGKFHFTEKDAVLAADVLFISKDSMRYHAYPYLQIDSMGVIQADDTLFAQNLFVRFAGVTEDRKVKIGIRESSAIIDFVAVKAFIFPYVNLVWLGLIIMAAGMLISMVQRARISGPAAMLIYAFALAGLSYMFFLGAA